MIKRLLIAAAALLPAWTAGVAAEDSEGRRVRVGLGAQIQPEYYGGDKSEIGPLWSFDVASGDDQFRFEAPDDGFDIALYKSGGFAAGPVGKVEGSRKNSDVGAQVGKVGTTIEAGVFAQYEVADSFRVRSEVRKGIGGHEGWVGSIGADKIWRDGDNYVFSIGPRVLFSDGRYQRAYFGVSPAAALATGLPQYRPHRGVHAVAATSGMSYQFNKEFGMFGFARFERLVGDAGKSPLVRELGSRYQTSAGIGLSYTFLVK